jgi:hypothetical protein
VFNALLRLWKDGSKPGEAVVKHRWISGIDFTDKEEEEYGNSKTAGHHL